MNKQDLRKRLSLLRSAVTSKDDKDKLIQSKTLEIITGGGYRNVFVYVSMKTEVDTHFLIRALIKRGIRVCVPYIFHQEMLIKELLSAGDLSVDGFGNLLNNATFQNFEGHCDCAVVPMLGFNAENYRIGYGGGYYDRFLNHRKVFTIGQAFQEQFIDFQPDQWDVPLDVIVTQNGCSKNR